MTLKVLWWKSQVFAQVFVHQTSIRLYNLMCLNGLCFSDAVKMSSNLKHI